MNFNDQDRSGVVTLSAAKGLARWTQRCFARRGMTGPVLVGKFHYRSALVNHSRRIHSSYNYTKDDVVEQDGDHHCQVVEILGELRKPACSCKKQQDNQEAMHGTKEYSPIPSSTSYSYTP